MMMLLIPALSLSLAHAQGPTVKVGKINTDEDTQITIKKGAVPSTEPEYEFTNESDEVSGEPALGPKAARALWNTACADWKKEMREMNKKNEMLSLSCGTPVAVQEANGQMFYKSEGHYKLKVRVRGEARAVEQPATP